MERNENVMLRWMCGVTLRDKVPTVELRRRLGIEGVVEARRGRLRWFGHVERKEVDDWVSACRNLEVAGSRGRGRPRMTWRALGRRYEGYGAKARDGNGLRKVEVWHHGENV